MSMQDSVAIAAALLADDTLKVAVRREVGPSASPVYRLTAYRERKDVRYYVDTRYVALR